MRSQRYVLMLKYSNEMQWQRKFAKSGGAIFLERKCFYDKKLKFYGAPLKSGGAAAP